MRLASVEVGGSGVQVVVQEGAELSWSDTVVEGLAGIDAWGLAAPGLVEGRRVRGAHHLGWMDVDAPDELGIASAPVVAVNDAAAAGLGEYHLRRGTVRSLTYIGMGTGIGAVAVVDGVVEEIDLGHRAGFGSRTCGGCGQKGCLDANIGGGSRPGPWSESMRDEVADALSRAIELAAAADSTIVLAGGVVRSYPDLVERVARRSPGRPVQPSAEPLGLKSAAYVAVLEALRETRAGSGGTHPPLW